MRLRNKQFRSPSVLINNMKKEEKKRCAALLGSVKCFVRFYAARRILNEYRRRKNGVSLYVLDFIFTATGDWMNFETLIQSLLTVLDFLPSIRRLIKKKHKNCACFFSIFLISLLFFFHSYGRNVILPF